MKRLMFCGAMLAMLGFGNMAQARDLKPAIQNSKTIVIESKAEGTTPAMAKRVRAEAKNTREPDETFVGIGGECHVDSRVNVYIRVYINGRYRGTIPPWGDIYPFVGDHPEDITDLYAVSTCGRFHWGPRSVYGSCGNYHWILDP